MTKKKHNRNTEGLERNAREKNQATIDKVNAAIDKLKRSKTKSVNFTTVAKEAGVTRMTLYNNPRLKERISSLSALEKVTADGKVVDTPKDKKKAKDERIKQLYEENKRLKEEKSNLVVQLVRMVELQDQMKELLEEKERLKAKLDKYENIKG